CATDESQPRPPHPHLRAPASHRRPHLPRLAPPAPPDPAGALPRRERRGARGPGPAQHPADVRGRARTILRPTGRGVVVLVACAALWLLGDLTRIEPARQLAAGLVLVLAVGAIGILVAGR